MADYISPPLCAMTYPQAEVHFYKHVAREAPRCAFHRLPLSSHAGDVAN